jgi:hypothetical protein
MTGRSAPRHCQSLRARAVIFLAAAVVMVVARTASAQAGSYERTYRQSKIAVERALKELQPSLGGRLPALEGFAVAGDRPLNRYQRAYYQSAVQVSSTASGTSVVRVTTKVTAWYADAVPSHSGYQLLTSNGRLESDLLDQLTELLATNPGATSPSGTSGDGSEESTPALSSSSSPGASAKRPSREKRMADRGNAESSIPEPGPGSPDTRNTFSPPSSIQQGLSAQQLADSKNSRTPLDRQASTLEAEAASLEEVLKNLAHPKNLVAVKKTGTPVVAAPSLTGKTLFLATAHDEFEMLDYSADWVHVRMSGLSRGWIWRTSLEMPEGISDVPRAADSATPVAADLFQVTREEIAPFPGDWEPLRGRNVKIISVQKIQENEKNSGAQAKLAFAKSLLDKNYAELAAKSKEIAGIVLIFDSIDGGMIAATGPTVQQWRAGNLTDAALWHQCYFDPPETFSVSSPSGGI